MTDEAPVEAPVAAPVPDFDPEAYAPVAAAMLGIPLDPGWSAPVVANLRVLHAAAARVGAFALPDEAEVAPVYEA